MQNHEATITQQVLAVCPIHGITFPFGVAGDKAAWRIDFAREATQSQRDAAAGVIASFDVAATENAERAETAAVDALDRDTRSDALYAALKNASAAEINTFINNTFPAMTGQQRAVLKLLLSFTALGLRRQRAVS